MFRILTGSTDHASDVSGSEDIRLTNPRMCVALRKQEQVGWYPTGCCASAGM